MVSCDQLQEKMGQFDGSGAGGTSEALAYLALYAMAKAQGCSFLDHHDHYHEDPTKGGAGKLHRLAWSDQSQKDTPMLGVDNEGWVHGWKRDRAEDFKFVCTGETGWHGKRYFMVVASGAYGGQVITQEDGGHLRAHKPK